MLFMKYLKDFREETGAGERVNPMFSTISGPFQYREGKKLTPKPNYNSVDLSEVEWEDRAETVSRETGRETI